MGNTSEIYKDKVAGDDDDGGAGDVPLISAVDPNCGHVRQLAGKAPRQSVQFS